MAHREVESTGHVAIKALLDSRSWDTFSIYTCDKQVSPQFRRQRSPIPKLESCNRSFSGSSLGQLVGSRGGPKEAGLQVGFVLVGVRSTRRPLLFESNCAGEIVGENDCLTRSADQKHINRPESFRPKCVQAPHQVVTAQSPGTPVR